MSWQDEVIELLLNDFQALSPDSEDFSVYQSAQIGDAVRSFAGAHDNLSEWLASLEENQATLHNEMRQAKSPAMLGAYRSAYTDCCILLGLVYDSLSKPLQAIGALDKSIIIAGPYKPSRLELVQTMIQLVQQSILLLDSPGHVSTQASRLSVDDGSHCSITCLPSPPSLLAFKKTYQRQPFILRGFASDWPALRERAWSSGEYLKSVAGPGRIVPVEVGSDYRANDWSQRLMGWDDFLSKLDLVGNSEPQCSEETLYLAQYDLSRQFPRLLEDIHIPDYVYSAPQSDYSSYRPPSNEDQLIINMWLGKATMSPPHTDPYHNFYCQIVGSKQVWLAPPSASDSMYSFTASSGRDGSDMANTSQVDVFRPDTYDHFPSFKKDVVPAATTAQLQAGDVLYFPPGWWHAMRTQGTSFSTSLWF